MFCGPSALPGPNGTPKSAFESTVSNEKGDAVIGRSYTGSNIIALGPRLIRKAAIVVSLIYK